MLVWFAAKFSFEGENADWVGALEASALGPLLSRLVGKIQQMQIKFRITAINAK